MKKKFGIFGDLNLSFSIDAVAGNAEEALYQSSGVLEDIAGMELKVTLRNGTTRKLFVSGWDCKADELVAFDESDNIYPVDPMDSDDLVVVKPNKFEEGGATYDYDN